MTNLTTRELTSVVGAEIAGVDLARPLNDATFAAIHESFLDRGVLVFRDQAITAEQHLAFTRLFGEPEVYILDQFLLPGEPHIVVVSNRKGPDGAPLGVAEAGRFWHTDLSFAEEPSLATFLYAIEVPPEDGDTLFAGMTAAYEALPTDLKARIKGLKGVHVLNKTGAAKARDEQLAKLKPVLHPLVRTHPETGHQAIYAGTMAVGVDGLPESEALALLDRLADFCAQPRFVYRHRWRAGDLVVWDNRCVLHRATEFDPRHPRHMHRTTAAGDRPV